MKGWRERIRKDWWEKRRNDGGEKEKSERIDGGSTGDHGTKGLNWESLASRGGVERWEVSKAWALNWGVSGWTSRYGECCTDESFVTNSEAMSLTQYLALC